jgi:LCP family protein required for cell wall assembly
MDNFKKHTPKSRSKHRPSIDGMISSTSGPVRKETSKQRAFASGKIGDFSQAEGFHPIQQGSIAGTQQNSMHAHNVQADELLDLDDIELTQDELKPKKRWFQFWKRSGKKLTRKQKIIRGVLLALGVVLLIGGFLVLKGYFKLNNVLQGGGGAPALQAEVDPTRLKGEGDGRVNILLLGKGGPGHDGPDLTDTILIASIDPINKDAALLSLPRDLYVQNPDGYQMKINTVYPTAKNQILNGPKIDQQSQKAEEAGMKAIESVVKNVTGIPIHYHAMVDFTGFKKAIDAVGGITIDVKKDLYDYNVAWENNNSPLIAAKGVQKFDGKKALLYARSRYGSARGDFDRNERQREVILALRDKVLSAGTFSNPVRISQLLDAFGNHVRVNMTLDEMNRLYEIGREIDSTKVTSVGLADPPNILVKTANQGGISIVVPKAGMFQWAEIQKFVRNKLKDGYIRSENPAIMVLNGTNVAGLATKKADDLKSYGYNIIKVDTAPTTAYAKTILVDLRNGEKKYTKRYLEQRFNTSAVTSLPDTKIVPGVADFVIILGQNESNSN